MTEPSFDEVMLWLLKYYPNVATVLTQAKAAQEVQLSASVVDGPNAKAAIAMEGLPTKAPWKCPVCIREFQSCGNLKRHFRSHTGVKDFKCEFCDSAFVRNDQLQRHRKLKHIKGGSRLPKRSSSPPPQPPQPAVAAAKKRKLGNQNLGLLKMKEVAANARSQTAVRSRRVRVKHEDHLDNLTEEGYLECRAHHQITHVPSLMLQNVDSSAQDKHRHTEHPATADARLVRHDDHFDLLIGDLLHHFDEEGACAVHGRLQVVEEESTENSEKTE